MSDNSDDMNIAKAEKGSHDMAFAKVKRAMMDEFYDMVLLQVQNLPQKMVPSDVSFASCFFETKEIFEEHHNVKH